MSPDYRTNHFWPLVHIRVPGTEFALCGRLPGERLLAAEWDDFTCPTCLACWEARRG